MFDTLKKIALHIATGSFDSKKNPAKQARIFQIYYSEQTREQLDPGFISLDNMANPRPDWREYYPIRSYLLNHELDENCYYGFFSSKFKEKTGLDSKAVFDWVRPELTTQ